MILENSELIYKSLLKINQIGKKISNTSDYIYSNGIILGFSQQEMSDTTANPVSIGFLEKSLYKKVGAINSIPAFNINGNKLYEYSKNYEFDSIEISEKGLIIKFIYYSVNESSYESNFKEILRNKGYTEEAIEYHYTSNYVTDMDMYDLFLKYKKEYTPIEEKTYLDFNCDYIESKNFMYDKSEKIIDELINAKLLYSNEIDRDILDIILNANQPITKKIELSNGDNIKIRLMKSIFSPMTSKNTASINIYKTKNRYLFNIQLELNNIILFNIFNLLIF